MKTGRKFKVFAFCLIIAFSFALISVVYGREVHIVREDEILSAMARKLLGDRLFEKWKIKVWVGDEKEMGSWLGGANMEGDVVINSKYLEIPDDEMALLLGHEISHV